jgi:polar amino acid transport system substrate-binding protein
MLFRLMWSGAGVHSSCNRQRHLCCLFSWIFCIAVLSVQQQAYAVEGVVLKLGMYHSPPYYHTENVDTPAGLSLDLLTPVAKQLGFRLEVVPCPFPRCLKMAEQGELDIVAGLINNQQRRQFLHFLSPPMMQFHSAFVFYAKAGNPLKIEKLADLKGHSVAVLRNGVYFPAFDNASNFTRVPVHSEVIALEMVAIGRVDFAITVEKTALESLQNAGLDVADLQRQSYSHQQHIDGYLAFAKKSPHIAMATQIETVLQQLAQQGFYQKVWQQYGLIPN